jgi:hypothetical protein
MLHKGKCENITEAIHKDRDTEVNVENGTYMFMPQQQETEQMCHTRTHENTKNAAMVKYFNLLKPSGWYYTISSYI